MELARRKDDHGSEDEQLIARVGQGDRSAFDLLVRRHGGWAHGFARRLLRDPDAADDVTQEAFLRVYRALPRFRGSAGFRTYLYRVVLNCCRDAVARKRREEKAVEAMTSRSEAGRPRTADPSEPARAREFEESIRAMVHRLPPAQRESLVLRVYEGLRYDEIAGLLGVSVNAVKLNLSVARSKLASWIGASRGMLRRKGENG